MAKARNAQGRFADKDPAWMNTFLDALRDTANVRLACRAAGVDRATAYRHRESEPMFALAWSWAVEDAVEALEAEARRRAYAGWDEPVFQRGEQVGTIRKFSDVLLIFLLKAHRPGVYRERLDVTVTARDMAKKLAAGLEGVNRFGWSNQYTNWWLASCPQDAVIPTCQMNRLTVTGNSILHGAQQHGGANGGLSVRADKANVKNDYVITGNTTAQPGTGGQMFLDHVHNLTVTGNTPPTSGSLVGQDTNPSGTRATSPNP